MPTKKQQFGAVAEKAAADFLQRRGYEIIGTHVTNRYGEIDILCRDENTWVAVEVKIRRSDRFGTAIESVTPRKLEKLLAALHEYLDVQEMQTDDVRVDVVAMDRGSRPGMFTIQIYQGVGSE